MENNDCGDDWARLWLCFDHRLSIVTLWKLAVLMMTQYGCRQGHGLSSKGSCRGKVGKLSLMMTKINNAGVVSLPWG